MPKQIGAGAQPVNDRAIGRARLPPVSLAPQTPAFALQAPAGRPGAPIRAAMGSLGLRSHERPGPRRPSLPNLTIETFCSPDGPESSSRRASMHGPMGSDARFDRLSAIGAPLVGLCLELSGQSCHSRRPVSIMRETCDIRCAERALGSMRGTRGRHGRTISVSGGLVSRVPVLCRDRLDGLSQKGKQVLW